MTHRLAAASIIALMAAAPAWAQTSTTAPATTTPGTTTPGTTTSSSQPAAKPLKPSQMSGSSTTQRREHGNAQTDAQTRQLNEQELSRLQPKT
jgi:hypothetical protein